MSNEAAEAKGSIGSRVSTLAAVTNALKFFALALLIVEALIGMLALQSPSQVLTLSYLGTIMFIFVVGMVVLLVFKRPREIIADNPDQIKKEIENKEEEKMRLEESKSIVASASTMEAIAIPPTDSPQLLVQSRPERRP